MTVPAVTNITSRVSSWDASGFINAIRDHIVNDTTHLQVDAYTVDEGVTVGFVDGGEDHQVNFRKNSADDIAISIEPSGSITDPGDSVPTAPTGTSADWSAVTNSERIWQTDVGSPAAGSKVWIVELADAFFIWVTDTGDDFFVWAVHAGRIVTPVNSADASSNGQDGLGILNGVPDNGSGTSNDWISSDSGQASQLHWATNEWSDEVEWYAPSNSNSLTPLASETSYRPLSAAQHLVAADIEGQSAVDGVVGPPKYIRIPPAAEDTKSIVPAVTGNQGWMYYNDIATGAGECAIWDKTVTP